MPQSQTFKTIVGSEEITFETGKLAGQAGGAVTVRAGDTLLLCTATMAREPRAGIDFFPLSVDYEERLYAAGKIPGSYFRREGRPTDGAILVCRLIDRPLRPLFPKDLRNDVQVIITSLSSDQEHQIDILGIIGASAAMTISNIPFGGPVGAVRVGYIGEQLVVNPTASQMAESTLDLRLAGTADAILMVECGANELPEHLMVEALRFGHEQMQPIIAIQNQMRAALGKPKSAYQSFAVDEKVVTAVRGKLNGRIAAILNSTFDKDARNDALDELEEEVVAELTEEASGEAVQAPGVPLDSAQIKEVFHDELKTQVRGRILNDGVRPDGRKLTQIRPLSAETGLSPRAHGSGLFTRGETQVLTIATLGTPRDQQEIEDLVSADSKRYMHHYNFPPYSTGEARVLRGKSRREVGHGALAERALMAVIPPENEFPYTIRLVSEVLSSNGSTSMASVCGSTLALLDAGVPIKSPVGGIAMGLITDGDRYSILTDIQGMEDHLGDMDFKVAGTEQGITALQMDIKVKGLRYEILEQALAQAREARMQILQVIRECMPGPRPELSPYAPRITTIHIPVDKIGAVIGPGGKVIRGIQEETGVKIDIEEDGTVYIAATDGAAAEMARSRVEALTETPEIGRVYTGKVVRVADFGVFVEIMPGVDGMVHISQLADYRVNKVEDVAKLGDEIMVMITDIDPQGKIRLSRQAVLQGWTPEEAREHDSPRSSGRPSGGGDRGGDRRGGGRPSGDRRGGGGDRRGGSGDRRPRQ
jgi:polyribonucleotide nucleotidyltransferase